MKQPLNITIPKPCHEDWAQMTPVEKGRFCSHCHKTVIDLSGYSDAELFRFFENRSESICGRMRVAQVRRPILPPHPPHSHLFRMAAALGFTLLLTGSAAVNACPRAPFAFAPVNKHKHQKKAHVTDDTTAVRGVIFNSEGYPMPVRGAVVKLMVDGRDVYTSITDSLGLYSILGVAPGRYTIVMECGGYTSHTTGPLELPCNQFRRDYLAPLWDDELIMGDVSSTPADTFEAPGPSARKPDIITPLVDKQLNKDEKKKNRKKEIPCKQ